MGTLDVTKIPATYKCSNQRHHQQVQHNGPHGGLRNDDLPLLQEGEVGPTVERNTTPETDSLLIVAGVSLFMPKSGALAYMRTSNDYIAKMYMN